MRRARCVRCHGPGLALLVVLIGVTLVGYGVLLALHQPLAQFEDLVPLVFHQPAAVDSSSSPRSRRLPSVALGVAAQSLCAGRLVAYGREFARLTDAVVERRLCRSQRRGGEPIDAVINQPESLEYYRVDQGCFRLACTSSKLDYAFAGAGNHLNSWMHSLQLTSDEADVDVRPRFTIAVTRYEYANLYHTMTDWYNAFLLVCFFNETSDSTDILFVDSHPRGALDPVWRRLFRRTVRLSELSSDRPTSFRRLVWGWLGYNSLMTIYQSSPTPPLIEEFRAFFLAGYSLPTRSTAAERPDCAAMRLSVLFIWRRDYVAHPRNPRGTVSRKIANEDELVSRVSSVLPQARVRGVQIDLYTMDEQLRLIVDADILIGEHGQAVCFVCVNSFSLFFSDPLEDQLCQKLLD